MKTFRIKQNIVFENDDFLAINKPAGISSLHERLGEAISIIELVKSINEEYQLCHRIDKDTSGVLLISKHKQAYIQASKTFEKRKVKKLYHAVVDGVHTFENLTINLPLITTRSGRAAINHQKGKPSTTSINSIENFGHYTLVACEPITGRQHQIRLHLASQHASITADTVYGGKLPYLSKLKRNFTTNKTDEESPMIARFVLHAYSLELPGLNEEPLHIIAPYPNDMEVFVKLLRKYDKPNF
ncbi:MAG: hypothetical protein RLZZ337_1655 [Bacteroidota bacterium]|jgi:23S rRNA pseudouridine955/2504/2580 synthase